MRSILLATELSTKMLMGFLTGVFTSILIGIVIWIKEKRKPSKEKKANEERKKAMFLSGNPYYYQLLIPELKEVCNPRLFMEDYNHEKVSIAGQLYQELQKTGLTTEEIVSIRQCAEESLGKKLSTQTVYEALKEECNPIRFTIPEKFAKANDLYNQVILNKYNLSQLESISEEARKESIIEVHDGVNNEIVVNDCAAQKTDQQNKEEENTRDSSEDKSLKKFALIFLITIIPAIVIIDHFSESESTKLNQDSLIQANILSTRKTTQYSINYPYNWRVIEKPDSISEVYIGAESGDIGFTILYFDSGYSIDRVNSDGLKSMRKAGMSVVSNDKVSINGYSGYKTVYDFSFNETDCRQISYTIKNGKTVYNIKFGNNRYIIDQNLELIEKIINSFNIN